MEGDHNSHRAQEVNDKISSFFYFGLYMKELMQPDQEYIQEQKAAHKAKKQKDEEIVPFNMAEIDYGDENLQDNEEELAKAVEESLKIHQSEQKPEQSHDAPKKE